MISFFLAAMVILFAALFMIGALDSEPSEALTNELKERTGIDISEQTTNEEPEQTNEIENNRIPLNRDESFCSGLSEQDYNECIQGVRNRNSQIQNEPNPSNCIRSVNGVCITWKWTEKEWDLQLKQL